MCCAVLSFAWTRACARLCHARLPRGPQAGTGEEVARGGEAVDGRVVLRALGVAVVQVEAQLRHRRRIAVRPRRRRRDLDCALRLSITAEP